MFGIVIFNEHFTLESVNFSLICILEIVILFPMLKPNSAFIFLNKGAQPVFNRFTAAIRLKTMITGCDEWLFIQCHLKMALY